MDDKMFELIEKMYSDLTSRIDSIEKNMATKQDIVKLEDKMVTFEDKMDTNHKVLHDGYKQTYEKLTDVEEKLDRQEEILKGHDLEIKVIRNIK